MAGHGHAHRQRLTRAGRGGAASSFDPADDEFSLDLATVCGGKDSDGFDTALLAIPLGIRCGAVGGYTTISIRSLFSGPAVVVATLFIHYSKSIHASLLA